MPLTSKMSKEETFHDLRHGKTYSKTKGRHGKKTANRQMVAIALKHERDKKRKESRKSSRR